MAYDLASQLSEVEYAMDMCLRFKGDMEAVAAKYEEVHKVRSKIDRQCTCNVRLWRVPTTIVAVEKQ